ncbi:MAG: 50S ribosomal protein L21e [Candidatus Hecatellales archaeon]|nr:MAG: 50S ribosomal protein L21e [Candidatus Hecatellales archaeon]RLI33922.1 MAG: 50S ribosomal protein L21e [Candidatus Bathyarchaeota archaeon]
MVKSSKGFKHSTRQLLRKKPRERGLKPLGYLLTEFKVGEKVVVDIDPSVHKGQPHRRYQGKIGTVVDRRGRAYILNIKVGGKTKQVIALPEHLRRFT